MSSERAKTVKDLPIYFSNEKEQAIWVNLNGNERGEFEKAISNMRKSGIEFLKSFNNQKVQAIEFYETNKASLNKHLEYIRSETNIIPKVVFISLSGFSGLLIGYKRSAFRKLFYSSVLTTGATAICFPKEAKQYSNQAYDFSKIYANKLYKEYIWPEDKLSSQKSKVRSKSSNEEVSNTTSKDKIVKVDGNSEKKGPPKAVVENMGQSSEQDKDMYTTRSK